MAKPTLPTNYLDDIMNAGMGGKRRYKIINNSDGTVSLEDATRYDQVGSNFGAGQLNTIGTAVNQCADQSVIIDGLPDIAANTQAKKIAGALAVKTLYQRSGGLEFHYQDGKGYYKAVGADTWIPFSGFQKFSASWSWNSSGSTTVNINISSMPAYNSLAKESMIATLGSVRGSVSNTGAPINVIIRSLSYNAGTGIASIVVGYDTWCVTSLSGAVVLIVAG